MYDSRQVEVLEAEVAEQDEMPVLRRHTNGEDEGQDVPLTHHGSVSLLFIIDVLSIFAVREGMVRGRGSWCWQE